MAFGHLRYVVRDKPCGMRQGIESDYGTGQASPAPKIEGSPGGRGGRYPSDEACFVRFQPLAIDRNAIGVASSLAVQLGRRPRINPS